MGENKLLLLLLIIIIIIIIMGNAHVIRQLVM